MIFREAQNSDIKQLFEVRLSVHENRLSAEGLKIVTGAAYEEFINARGKGWVCEVDEKILGFAIADLVDHNIWALFVRPEYEGQGIGQKLHDIMMEWYFKQTGETVWLSTDAKTKAEKFYRKNGWEETGRLSNGEIMFEMSAFARD